MRVSIPSSSARTRLSTRNCTGWWAAAAGGGVQQQAVRVTGGSSSMRLYWDELARAAQCTPSPNLSTSAFERWWCLPLPVPTHLLIVPCPLCLQLSNDVALLHFQACCARQRRCRCCCCRSGHAVSSSAETGDRFAAARGAGRRTAGVAGAPPVRRRCSRVGRRRCQWQRFLFHWWQHSQGLLL